MQVKAPGSAQLQRTAKPTAHGHSDGMEFRGCEIGNTKIPGLWGKLSRSFGLYSGVGGI